MLPGVMERVVVVGAGSISDAWFPPLAAEGLDVAAVVDLDPARARAAIARHRLEAQAAEDLDAVLVRVRPDLVLDLTVPEAHAAVTVRALRRGAHVLGEKPMASTLADARRMVRAAEGAGRLYVVSQSFRWQRPQARVHRAVAGGLLGRVDRIDCSFYRGPRFGGFRDAMPSPLLGDMSIHHFDLARHLSGQDPVAVYAAEQDPAGSWYAGAAAASAIVELTGGAVFTYTASWAAEGLATPWPGQWRVVGERGTITLSGHEVRAELVDGHGTAVPAEVPAADLVHETQHESLRQMLSALRGGPVPSTECHDNIRSLALVHAAIRSAALARRVPVRAGV